MYYMYFISYICNVSITVEYSTNVSSFQCSSSTVEDELCVCTLQ